MCYAETNIPWTKVNVNSATTVLRQVGLQKPVIQTSDSTLLTNSQFFQSGGAATITYGKWTHCIVKRISDSR